MSRKVDYFAVAFCVTMFAQESRGCLLTPTVYAATENEWTLTQHSCLDCDKKNIGSFFPTIQKHFQSKAKTNNTSKQTILIKQTNNFNQTNKQTNKQQQQQQQKLKPTRVLFHMHESWSESKLLLC